MADLTQNAPPLRYRSEQVFIERWTLDNSAAQQVWRGQPMILDASADTVNARGWVAATTLVTAADIFVGIANEKKTVLTTDVEGNNEIEIITKGEVGFKTTAFTDADVGKVITMSDSAVFTTNAHAANRLPIGTLRRVVDGYAYIDLNAPRIMNF